ncbi:MAG TPA: hypothetical protein VFX80_02565, partial [Solirubrobacteraceae bacterium]|nr:hypothetical protein [Solirubrobacteraceae bacterium]
MSLGAPPCSTIATIFRARPLPTAGVKRTVPRAFVVRPITFALSPPSSVKVTRWPGRARSRQRRTRLVPLPLTCAETRGDSSTAADAKLSTAGEPVGVVTRHVPRG